MWGKEDKLFPSAYATRWGERIPGSRVEIVTTLSARLQNDVALSMNFIGDSQHFREDFQVHCAEADLVYRDGAVFIARKNKFERLVDLDEGLQEWRYRHVKMVERTIGTKAGTGGSAGAAYLRETTGRAVFPDLWAVRSRW